MEKIDNYNRDNNHYKSADLGTNQEEEEDQNNEDDDLNRYYSNEENTSSDISLERKLDRLNDLEK